MSSYDIDGVTQTARDAGGVNNKLLGGLIDARVKVMLDQYVLAGTEVSGTTLGLFGTLPAGANIIGFALSVSAAQTSLTADFGDAADDDRYTPTASTGLQTIAPAITWLSGLNYVIGTATNDNQIVLTTGGATATAGTLYAACLYTTD